MGKKETSIGPLFTTTDENVANDLFMSGEWRIPEYDKIRGVFVCTMNKKGVTRLVAP